MMEIWTKTYTFTVRQIAIALGAGIVLFLLAMAACG
jgi:hypothetical protein